MTTAPRYIVYKCNVCSRLTELVLDGDRPDPNRCNITEKCRGKLDRVGKRSVREFLFTPLVPGLQDFIPRGTAIIPAPQLTIPNPITVFTANGTGMIAMSIVRLEVGSQAEFRSIDSTDSHFILETQPISYIPLTNIVNNIPRTAVVRAVLYEISPELLTSNIYIYSSTGPVSIVRGRDNSPESKNLRFSNAPITNRITVYVNGIELTQTVFDTNGVVLTPGDYDRSVDNQITFTPTIYDSNNVVEVFVYQDLSVAIVKSKQVTLEFRSLVPTISTDNSLRELNCWGNYSSSMIGEIERYTLFCTDLTKLNIDKNYRVAYFETTDENGIIHRIKSSEVFILLGKEPFAFRDKELHAYLTGGSLIDLQIILTYKESPASGELYLSVDETAIIQVYNQIIPLKLISMIQTTATSTAVPGTPLVGSENLSQKYILGPV